MSHAKVSCRMFEFSAVFPSLSRFIRLVYHPTTMRVVFFISLCLIKCEPKVPFEVQTPNLFTCIVITSEDPGFLFWTVGVVVYHKTHLQSFIIVFLITLMQVHLLLISPGAAKHNKYSACLRLMRSSASQPANRATERQFFSCRRCVSSLLAHSL